MNEYIFIMTSIFLFLFQLFVLLIIFRIMFMMVGWPIKSLVKRIFQVIKRSQR